MSGRRVVLWNAVFGYGSLALTVTRNLLLVPLYLHFVPLAEYGAWLATGGALVQLLMTDYGLAGVVTQRIASAGGAGAQARARELISAALVNALLLGLLLAAVGAAIAAFLPATQGLDAAAVRRVMQCFLIAVFANAVGVLTATSTAAVRGLQKPVAAGAATLGADLLSVAVTLLALFAGWGLYGIALGLATRSVLLATASITVLANARLAAPAAGISWTASLELWRDSARFFVTSIAMRLMAQANVLAVGMVLGPASAAVYGLTVRAHETVLLVLAQLNSALGPTLAHLAGAGQHARLDAFIARFLPFSAAAAALGAVGVAVLNPSFVALWVGEGVYGGFAVTALMSLALWIASVGYVAYEALLARGEFTRIARAFACAAALHVLLLTLFVRFGMAAAPAALALSSATWALIFWRQLAPGAALARSVLTLLVAALLAAALLLWSVPAAHGWLSFAATAAVVLLVTAALLLAASPALRRAVREELAATARFVRFS